MPNPHFDVKVISRKAGKSAVASASYRSGERLYDERLDRTFDYTRKDDVRHTEIMTPAHVPEWASQRQNLWNHVEAGEKRKDAQLARDIIAALPRELNLAQNIALVQEFVKENFITKGMIADLCVHEAESSDGNTNPHAHIMLTLRDVGAHGFGKKNREWNEHSLVPAWRDSWEELTNKALEAAGRDERVSLKSFEEQGIDKTPGTHMGHEAWNMEQKGQETEKGNQNREINHDNAILEIVVGNQQQATFEETEGIGDSKETKDILVQPSDDATAEKHHQFSLYQYFRSTTLPSLRASGELVTRMELYRQAFVDKAREISRSIFNRFSDWTSREKGKTQEKQVGGHER